MDTPCQPRRKLKRVLKKVEKLNSSQKLSQKKLKAAINTSLNSTNSFRSLKNNNYSLALRLENVKEELKLLKNEKSELLEENFALREKVNSLEQMLLDGEGYKKNHVEGIKKAVKSLNNHISNCCTDLEQLAQICFSRSSSLESRRSSKTKQRSTSGDFGDCGFNPETPGKSPKPIVGQDDTLVNAEVSPSTCFEQQYTSSVHKMKDIERRIQMEIELPRRVPRSHYCLEEDEDIVGDPNELEALSGSNEAILEDSVMAGITGVEPPLSLDLTEHLDHEEVEISSDKRSAPMSRNSKRKKAPKQPGSVSLCDNLHIANQFALNAVHLNILEKNKAKETSFPDALVEDNDQTIHTAADMELTIPIDTTVLITKNPENIETFRDSLSSVKTRRLTKVLPENTDDQPPSQNSDELVPDAVTMRKMKPGHFKFAVGRKNSEGCRQEVVDMTRARSKSKKRIAELVEKLPQEEPKSIFDFHEKTPKFSSENREALSVYSLADESVTSPCAPLRKNKDTRATYSVGGLNSNESNVDHADMSSVEYSVPLKENLNNGTSRLSRSRSKKRTKNTRRSSIVDEHVTQNDSALDQHDKISLTLIEGEAYPEPLKDSPHDQSKKTSMASRGRSRSRRRTKPLSDVNTLSEPEDDTASSLVGGTTYSEPLKDSPQDQSKKTSRTSRVRSRSRRRTKPLPDVNALFESEDDTASTLVGGTTYSEPLQDCPQVQSKKTSGAPRGRSRSRRRTKPLPDVNTLSESEDDTASTLVGGTTYSEPLQDSPQVQSKKTSGAPRGRSRSRRRTKPLSDVNTLSEPEDDTASTLVGGTTYSEPLKGSPQDQSKKTSGAPRGRSRSRRRTKPLPDMNTLSESEDDTASTLVGGTTYSEPLKDGPQDQSKKTSGAPRGRSRSRRRTKPLPDVNTLSEPEDDTASTLVGGTTYSEPLKGSPQDQSKKTSGAPRGRSRSRRRTKPLPDMNTLSESEDDTASTLVGGTTYSEPLKDGPQDQSKKTSGAPRGRSRSRRRTKPLPDVNTLSESEDDTASTLAGSTTYSEPLQDSPQVQSKKTSGAPRGRSRSRRRTKPLSDVNTLSEPEDDTASTLVGGTTYSEPLKDSPQDQSKKTSGAPRGRSRSRRRTKPLPDVNTLSESEDDTASTLVGGTTYSEPLQDSPQVQSKKSSGATRGKSRSRRIKPLFDVNADDQLELDIETLDKTPQKLSKVKRSRLQRNTNKVNYCEDAYQDDDDDDDFLNCKQPDLVDVPQEIPQSEALLNSLNNKSKSMVKTCAISLQRLIVIGDTNDLSEPKDNDNALENDSLEKHGQKNSFLGESDVYSEPFKDSPVKTLKANGESKSQAGRLRRCTGLSLKKSNKGSATDKSTRSTGHRRNLSSEKESGDEEAVSILIDDENNSDPFLSIGDFEDNNEEHTRSNQDLPSVTTNKGKKSNKKSKRVKNVEKDDNSDSGSENVLDTSPKKSKPTVKRLRKRKHTAKDGFYMDGEEEGRDELVSSSLGATCKESVKSVMHINEQINPHVTSQTSDQNDKDHLISKSVEIWTDLRNSFSHSYCSTPAKEQMLSKQNSRSDSLASTSSLSPGSRDSQPGRQRRTKQITSYAEPSINKKLRRGDPFTAAHGSVKIFKSPKLQGTKKKLRQNVLKPLQNFPVSDTSIIE